MAEKPLIHYYKRVRRNNTFSNVIGATDDALREVPSNNESDTKYVSKTAFFISYEDITNGVLSTARSDGGGTNQWSWTIQSNNRSSSTDADNWVTVATVTDANGASSYVHGTDPGSFGTSSIRQWRVILTRIAGTTAAITSGDYITITTTLDPFRLYLSETTITSGTTIFYAGRTNESASDGDGQLYHDINLNYLAYFYTPTGSKIKPYFDIGTAYAALGGAYSKVGVFDSSSYDEELDATTDDNIFATSGFIPTWTRGVGARITRMPANNYHDGNAVFFNENGSSGGNGNWGDPFDTVLNAISGAGGKTNIVYGGSGAAGGRNIVSDAINVNGLILDAEYGYTPTFYPDPNPGGTRDLVVFNDGECYGFILDDIFASLNGGTIADCTVKNETTIAISVDADTGITSNVYRNYIFDCAAGIHVDLSNTGVCNIQNNYVSVNGTYGISFGLLSATATGNIKDNYISDSPSTASGGINIPASANVSLTIKNNMIKDCYNGIYLTGANTISGLGENIIYGNTVGIYAHTGTITLDYTILYNNTTDKTTVSGGTINSTNEITTDPKLHKTTAPEQRGIRPDGSAYKSDATENDIGPNFRIIKLSTNDLHISGFKFDGQSFYNSGIGTTGTSDYTGLEFKWNTLFNFQGLAIDLYSGADTDSTISYNKIFNCGSGLELKKSGNTIEYNLIYSNTIFGIYNESANTLNHSNYYGNTYGIYTKVSTTIKNSIFSANSSHGMFSDVSIVPSNIQYNCIYDAYNSNIDVSDSTNILAPPHYIGASLEGDSKNLKLKSIANGDTFNSPCVDAGESDIGAWQVSDRSVAAETWEKYELGKFPEFVNESIIPKDLNTSNNSEGTISLYAKSHKRVFPFVWTQNRYMLKELRNNLEFMATLIKTRENEFTDDNIVFRIHMLPSSFEDSGTSATVGATAKTLEDTTKTWYRNEHKGRHVGIKFTSGSATGTISAAGKTLTVSPSPSWTTDEWADYYIYNNGHYYIIDSNNATTLTLGDDAGTLIDQSNIDWAIEKYFKIKSNDTDTLTLIDKDTELVSGTYDWYIDFTECLIQNPQISFQQQPRFNYTREHSKTAQTIIWEEK